MSRLQSKRCSVFKEPCLATGCAQFDEKLDACTWNLLQFNLYKVAIAIEQATPEVVQDQQPGFPYRRKK